MVCLLKRLKGDLWQANDLRLFSICIDKTKNLHDSLDRYDIKGYSAKKKKLRDELFIGGKVLVLAERIKKKAAPYKFDKQNISYFNNNRFQKSELFTIRGNFIM